MKYLVLTFLSAVFLLLGAGCATSLPAVADVRATTEDGIAVGGRILNAIRAKDYPEFRSQLGQGVFGKEMTANDFDASCRQFQKQFGAIVGSSFLTELETPEVRNLIWKVTFERPSATAGNAPIRQELLFRLVTAKLDGKTEVMGMGFL